MVKFLWKMVMVSVCHTALTLPLIALVDSNEIMEIHHHKKNGTEAGSISLYFAQKINKFFPPVKESGSSGYNSKLSVFFPGLKPLSAKLRQEIPAITQKDLYEVMIEKVTQPENGINFTILYNSAKIDVKYDTFSSIGSKPGVIFTLVNKEMVQSLDSALAKPILRMTAADKKHGIVIDCGHGGEDSGARGFFDLLEKDLTLDIGLELAHLLKDAGFNVALTRNKDCNVTLGSRTSYANFHRNNDLFVSIHANHSANQDAAGIETWCLDYGLFNNMYTTMDQDLKKN